ncbi:MAG: hypothetical protein K2Y51_26080 [Gammaproteobacteria bacterium]|nr:hypothetical protein [Gammaproteobacteria bacterium]
MSAAEDILARATARGGQYEVWVGGGKAAFTSAEVGHALAGRLRDDGTFRTLPDGAVRVLLIKYAGGDERDAGELVRDLCEDAGGCRTWEIRAARMVVCRAVVAEFLRARRCEACLGRQTVMRGASVVTCEGCTGTGYAPASMQARAAALGLAFNTFKGGAAQEFYMGRLARLVEWESIGVRRVVGKARAA